MNGKTVHVLEAGLPLCGFTDAVPRDWPQGHGWIFPSDYSLHLNCEGCRQKLGELKGNAGENGRA